MVRKKNPNFYPIPVNRVPTAALGIEDEIIHIKTGFLTLDELVEAHGKLGNLLHANNPYREKILIEEFENLFPVWRETATPLLRQSSRAVSRQRNLLVCRHEKH